MISGTKDGLRWELNEVLPRNNFYMKGGIIMAFSDDLYLFWVDSSSWEIWMIHTAGGINTWSDPIRSFIDPTALSVDCAPLLAPSRTASFLFIKIILIYQNYGGVGAAPVPHSPAPTVLYMAQYTNNTWEYGQTIPIVGNPADPYRDCRNSLSIDAILGYFEHRRQ